MDLVRRTEGNRKNSVAYHLRTEPEFIYRRTKQVLGVSYLVCCVRHCPATVSVRELNAATEFSGTNWTPLIPHTHPGDRGAADELLLKARCKRRAEEEATTLRQIFDEERQM